MIWQYFQLHYQDNVIAGFINSIVIAIPSLLILLWRMEKHHNEHMDEIRKINRRK